MNWIHIELISIISVTALSATLGGIFMVLRGTALMSDAISHSILPGIVILFLIVNQIESPLLLLGAALSGLATVLLTEYIIQTKRIKSDAAIGIIFPLFFSIGILLINMYTRQTHLDVDMVLLGEVAFAPFNRLLINGIDFGPIALWSIGSILLIVSICLRLFYKELVLATFDPVFAHINGFYPHRLYYALMFLASIIIVSTLTMVGSVIIIAFMIIPTATAQLISNKLHLIIRLSLLLSLCASIYGYLFAHVFNVSIAGSIAFINGILFIITFINKLIH